MKHSLNWYVENGCELPWPSYAMFVAVYELARDRGQDHLCDGCNCKDTCPAWPKINCPGPLLSDVSGAKVKTNAELAVEMGLTKRQVAKLRREGKL